MYIKQITSNYKDCATQVYEKQSKPNASACTSINLQDPYFKITNIVCQHPPPSLAFPKATLAWGKDVRHLDDVTRKPAFMKQICNTRSSFGDAWPVVFSVSCTVTDDSPPQNSQPVFSGYKWWGHECRRPQAPNFYHHVVFTCFQWAVVWRHCCCWFCTGVNGSIILKWILKTGKTVCTTRW